MNISIIRVLAMLFAAQFGGVALALEAQRLTAPITLDGKLAEAQWASAPVSERFVENMPNEKQPARHKTQVRMLYDDAALYVGIRAFDDDLSKIVAPFARRDKVFGTMDNFIVWIDPTGARKFAQFFRVNPRGVLADGSWSEDASDESFAPDYDYEAVPAMLDDGWSAEFRIPWSTLRVPSPTPEALTFIVFRNMQRGTRIRMSNVELGKEPACFLCVAEPLTGIKNIPSSAGFFIAPYLTLSGQREAGRGEHEVKAGADVKWRVSNSWVVDATLLPDFSQLEIDAPQLRSNTRFAVAFPEKRPFFMEGSDLYGTPFGLVYTRSITDPRWGVRATSRSATVDATVLTVDDRGGSFVLQPNSYFSGARAQPQSQTTLARARVPVGYGSIAGLLTDRRYEDGTRNTVVSLDGLLKPSNEARLRGQVTHSETNEGSGTRSGHVVYADGLFDNGVTHVFAKAMEVSRGFQADTGFIVQNGFRELSGEAWRCFKRQGFFYELCPGTNAFVQRTIDGEVIAESVANNLFVNGALTSEWNVGARWHGRTRTRAGGPLHRTPSLSAKMFIRPSETFSLIDFNAEFGRGVDVAVDQLSQLRSVSLGTGLRPHARIELESFVNAFELRDLATDALRLRELSAQMVGIGYLTANDTVRLIAQHGTTRRNLALYPAALGLTPRASNSAVSFVFTKRWSLGRDVNVGVTWSEAKADAAPSARTLEGFVKVSWSFSR